MRSFVWLAGWVGVAVWSLVSALAYWFLDGTTSLLMRHADLVSDDPQVVEWVWTALSWLRGISTSGILVVWGLVSLAILSVPWLLDRAIGRGPTVAASTFRARPAAPYGDGSSVIDLAPGDYSVGPVGSGPAPDRRGSGVPRLGPRP